MIIPVHKYMGKECEHFVQAKNQVSSKYKGM